MPDDESTEHPLWSRWGAALKVHRDAAGWTQTELAYAARIHPNRVSEIERGVRGGSDATRMALARALRVPVHAIFSYPIDDEIGAAS